MSEFDNSPLEKGDRVKVADPAPASGGTIALSTLRKGDDVTVHRKSVRGVVELYDDGWIHLAHPDGSSTSLAATSVKRVERHVPAREVGYYPVRRPRQAWPATVPGVRFWDGTAWRLGLGHSVDPTRDYIVCGPRIVLDDEAQS